jgi:outer membrane protein assembly factor BamB
MTEKELKAMNNSLLNPMAPHEGGAGGGHALRQALATLAALLMMVGTALAGDWPGWRGPDGGGVSDERHIPITWSATQNVAWKTPLPGGGNSSPIVSGERVFITCATDKGAKRAVMCFDRSNGQLLWQGVTEFADEEPTHGDNPYCAATPTTDGHAVYASLGSAGFVAYDMDGKLLWKRDLGPSHHIWGNASSPVLYQDLVIQLTGPGPSVQLVALNKSTGEPVWQRRLAEAEGEAKQFKGSWSTPVIFINDGRDEMVLALPKFVVGINPLTGQEAWRCGGLSDLAYATPLIGRNVIVAMSGYQGPAIGFRTPRIPDAKGSGDITESHRLWVTEKNPQRVGSGVVLGDYVYIVEEPGVARCLKLETGEEVWKERLGQTTWCSTTLVDGRCYATDVGGTTYVFNPANRFKLIAKNPLGPNENTRATPAFSDGQIFIRTYEHLYCIGVRVRDAAK